MEDNHYLKMGSLFHDFAEFYVNHPKFVEERGYEKFVELMTGKLNPFIDNFMVEILKTKIRIGIENIIEFLERGDIESSELEDYKKKSWDNFFADHFDKSVEDKITEAWFENSELGAKGKVDLILDKNHLVDYKSGKKNSSMSIVRNSNVELFEEDPDFQAILYLAHHRMARPGEKLKFSFFHFLDNLENVIVGDANIQENIETVTYYPRNFSDQIAERKTFNYLIEGVSESNNRRKTLEKLGYSSYRSFFKNVELPHEYDKNELLRSEVSQEYISYSQGIVGEYKYVKNGCRSTLKKLCGFRLRNYFKEDLDRFEEFLSKQLENLNEYKKEGFPIGDVDLDILENRDLILGGTYETE